MRLSSYNNFTWSMTYFTVTVSRYRGGVADSLSPRVSCCDFHVLIGIQKSLPDEKIDERISIFTSAWRQAVVVKAFGACWSHDEPGLSRQLLRCLHYPLRLDRHADSSPYSGLLFHAQDACWLMSLRVVDLQTFPAACDSKHWSLQRNRRCEKNFALINCTITGPPHPTSLQLVYFSVFKAELFLWICIVNGPVLSDSGSCSCNCNMTS